MTDYISWKVIEADGYFKSFIDKNKRPDDRSFLEARPITVELGSVTTAEGSATVRLGNSTVVCGVKANICIPHLRKPNVGLIIPNAEIFPACNPKAKPGPPSPKSMATSKFLNDVIISSGLLDLHDLCIIPNKLVWALHCDVVVIDDDGNLNDVCLLALVAALKNVTLPKVMLDEDTEDVIVHTQLQTPYERLKLHSAPTSTTFTIYREGIYLLDPSEEDEESGQGQVTVVLKDDTTLCSTIKEGGLEVPPHVMEQFVTTAKDRANKLNKIIHKAEEKFNAKHLAERQ